MARKQNAESVPRSRNWGAVFRHVTVAAGILALAVLGLYVYYRVDQFLATDPRFRLKDTAESGQDSGIRIEGVAHASRARVLAMFAADTGRSVYLVPLRERRLQLLGIDWVGEASVSRLWPDRLIVRIKERTPVAFVQLPAGERGAVHRAALIDADGVILEQPERATFELPVLSGIRRSQSRAVRAARVQSAMRLVQDIGGLAAEVSEIDVSDTDNLKVVQQIGGEAVVLWLGDRNFLSRLQNFRGHYEEIRRRLAQAKAFDLRLDDRITAMGAGSGS
ncbi:MAG TPA: FtsQ-type POTRA domain-containing protein [Bryobacteraceae bacterium]|nr:FtsQ-type POTRA domain-containing protein [Bryobacteraceae bacterium]